MRVGKVVEPFRELVEGATFGDSLFVTPETDKVPFGDAVETFFAGPGEEVDDNFERGEDFAVGNLARSFTNFDRRGVGTRV